MTAEKFSASMDSEILAEARALAEEEGLSFSAWLTELARDRVKLLGWEKLIAEYEAEHGAFTEEELAEEEAERERAWREHDEMIARRDRDQRRKAKKRSA